MAAHAATLALSLSRALAKRADELAPPATDADILTAFADPIDVVGFARRVLGMMPWSRQREVLEALREWKRIGVVSGHKTGKSTALAIIALWFYCSFPNARVVITATSDRQVNGIIWREIRRLVKGALVPIPGAARMGLRAATGLTHPVTFSEIRGYTGDKTEAIAGTSGSYVLYLVDEASGVEQPIFDAIEGNRAGGNAWVFLISNPTKADGEFYSAFHNQSSKALGSAGYYNIRISSEESPNVTGEWAQLEEYDRKAGEWRKRTKPIPGIADPAWLAEKRIAWGTDSAQWKIRVAGDFAVAEEAKAFNAALLISMQDRWEDANDDGRLWIGVDPAGDGDGGDESGFCARAGMKAVEMRARRGISPEGHIAEARDMIAADAQRRAAAHKPSRTVRACVNIESEGEDGWRVYLAFKEYAERTGEFEVSRVRTSERAIRMPLLYDKVRDEMWAIARLWGREGGAIPTNDKLFDDLHAPEFASDVRGRLKLTSKKELRKVLGRSPDVGDAFVISCWEPLALREEETAVSGGASPGGYDVYDGDSLTSGELNPYGGINPYS